MIRGEDHISNTPRQLLIFEAFGWRPPAFAHVSLVMGPDHSPLSKRHGATSVAEFRARGYLPEALTNYLALLGWSPGEGEELVPIEELAPRFRLQDVGHSAGVFDVDKLAWVNRHYLKAAAPDRLARLSLPYLRQREWVSEPTPSDLEFLERIIPAAAGSVDRLEQVPARLGFLFDYSADACAGRAERACGGAGLARRDRRARRGTAPVRPAARSRTPSARRHRACVSAPARRGRRCFIRFVWRSLEKPKGSSWISPFQQSRPARRCRRQASSRFPVPAERATRLRRR